MAKICLKCNKEFPFRVKVNGKIKNLNSRKYCLECSPFGKHNTKKVELEVKGFKVCPYCYINKSVSDFYTRKDGRPTPYCKLCTNKETVVRQKKLKEQCVKYKGEKCERCGYNRCIGALEFHHINPEHKDFSIAEITKTKMNDTIKKELDKCILVCANCHREIHASWPAQRDSNPRPTV